MLTSDYVEILENCLKAWNRSDAETTASFYSENMDYRDPNVPQGIKTRADFARYLRILFKKWPRQEWTVDTVLPHEKPGAFSVCYRFRFANKKREIGGFGMDRIEFEGNAIRLNWVYLNAKKWPEWIKGG